MNSHDLIEAALRRAADLAPDEQRVRAVLLGQVARHRGRRTLLVAGAAVAAAGAVAVVGVPAALRKRAPVNVRYPSAYPTGSTEGTGNLRMAMALRPGWLPDGVTEQHRSATIGMPKFKQARLWQSPDFDAASSVGRAVFLLVRPQREPGEQPDVPVGGAQVSINGREGWLDQKAGPAPRDNATLIWHLGHGLIASIEVLGVPDADSAAIRIANSVTADEVAVCEVPIRFGWLPPDMVGDPVDISVNRADGPTFTATILDESAAMGESRHIMVSVGARGAEENGERVMIRGRQGYAAFVEGAGTGLVQLADGRWLTVSVSKVDSAAAVQAYLLRIADNLWIGPSPDTRW